MLMHMVGATTSNGWGGSRGSSILAWVFVAVAVATTVVVVVVVRVTVVVVVVCGADMDAAGRGT